MNARNTNARNTNARNTNARNTNARNTYARNTYARNTSVRAPLDNDLADDLADDLHRAVSLVEDWLLHASPETLDELADFAYGPAHHGHDQLRWITDLLGEAAARLRPAPLPAPAETTTTEPTSAQRGPSQ